MKVYFMLTICLILGINSAKAQITIGDITPPEKGALLDLKENVDGTSHKGLGMPRVELSDLSILRMGDNLVVQDADGTWKSHAGLMVYHIPSNPCPTIEPGLFVWTGYQWQGLIAKEEDRSQTFVDDRDPANPIVYRYRNFGKAGDWMIDNLRAKTYASPEIGTLEENVNQESSHVIRRYHYPNADEQTFLDHPDYGLLYNHIAASNGRYTDDVASNASGFRPSTVQGICPTGWYLPSDKDWSELEKEIAEHPSLYSSNSGTIWNPEWSGTPFGFRPESGNGHGASMKFCTVIDGVNSNGLSLHDGFCVKIIGGIASGRVEDHGISAFFWSSSNCGVKRAWYRYLGDEDGGVGRYNFGMHHMQSVRCKRH